MDSDFVVSQLVRLERLGDWNCCNCRIGFIPYRCGTHTCTSSLFRIFRNSPDASADGRRTSCSRMSIPSEASRLLAMNVGMDESQEAASDEGSGSSIRQGSVANETGMPIRSRYACTHPQCSKTFSRQAHLRRHAQSHGEEKPYKCEVHSCLISSYPCQLFADGLCRTRTVNHDGRLRSVHLLTHAKTCIRGIKHNMQCGRLRRWRTARTFIGVAPGWPANSRLSEIYGPSKCCLFRIQVRESKEQVFRGMAREPASMKRYLTFTNGRHFLAKDAITLERSAHILQLVNRR
jgi:hypothetical protein